MTHILITRPLESSQQLAGMLEARGLSAIVMPQYEFSEKDPDIDLTLAWATSKGRKLAIFTSPRAVQYGLPVLAGSHKTELEFAAIGPATKARLESCGYKVHLRAKTGYTSEDFLQIPKLAEEPGDAVIFCAPGGRKTLAAGLRNLGWQVELAQVYQRSPVLMSSEQLEVLSGVDDFISVWTSVSALEIAQEQLPEASWKKILGAPAIVISTRLQQYLQQAGATLVEQSDGPGNSEILKSVLRLSRGESSSGAAA
jgi:uroporphyrinogen-III synthase